LRVGVKKWGSTEYTRQTFDILHIRNDAQLKQAEKEMEIMCTVTSQGVFSSRVKNFRVSHRIFHEMSEGVFGY
jgi:hypothetical protein